MNELTLLRIGIFSDTWFPNINGVTFSIRNQLKVLSNDHELFLFVPKTYYNKLEQIPDSVKVYEFSGLSFPSYPGYVMSYPPIRSLRRIAHKQRLDLIHAHSPFLQCWYAMVLRHIQKIPMVVTYHTLLPEYVGHIFAPAEEQVKKMLYEPMWAFTRKQYNLHDAIITPSKVMRQELEDNGIKNVIDVPNPISEHFFNNNIEKNKYHANIFRSRFKISADKKIILYVGRISFEKRLEVLLRAYKTLHEKYSDTYLVIVGDGPQLGMYKEKAKKLALIDYVFTGYVHHQQLPGIYSAGDVFVSPSNTETQGLTFIEAMSQNIPVIGVNSRGVTD